MSRLTGSEVRSMMEAYNSIYAPQINEEQILEDFENWVYSLVDEGEDLSEYTWDEMYEAYNYINEQLAGEMGGGLDQAALAGMGALASGIGYYGSKAINAAQTLMSRRRSQSKPKGQTTRTPSFTPAKPSQRDTNVARGQQSATAAHSADENLPKGPKVTSSNTGSSKVTTGSGGNTGSSKVTTGSGGSGSSGSTGSGGSGGSGKPPNIDPMQTLKDVGAGLSKGKDFAKTAANQLLGAPARGRILGATRLGQVTRGAGVAAASAADLAGKAADPSKPSNIAKIGSLGPGAAGNISSGIGNIPGIKGSSAETGFKGAGDWLKKQGQAMSDSQTSSSPTPSSSSTPSAPTPTPPQKPKTQTTSKLYEATPNLPLTVAGGATGTGVGKNFRKRPWTPAEVQRYKQTRGAAQLAADKQLNQDITGSTPGTPAQLTAADKKSLEAVRAARAAGSPTGAPGTSAARPTGSQPSSSSAPRPGTGTPPAGAPRPTGSQPAPTKPAIERSPRGYAVGTTAGGTKYEIRTPTSAELAAAQKARAEAKASGNIKGAEEAAVKAAVGASKPAPTPAATPAIRSGGFGASANQAALRSSAAAGATGAPVRPAATTTQATTAAGSSNLRASTGPTLDPANVSRLAAAKPSTPNPSPKNEPLWEKVEEIDEVMNITTQSSRRKSLGRGASIRDGSKPTGYESPNEFRKNQIKYAPYQTSGRYNDHLKTEQVDAFDVVLEYLLSQGHVDTLDEALYVMMEMDGDCIQSICEAKYGTAKGRKALAKKIRKGEDVGKPGGGFEKIVKKASPKVGKKRATKIAAAAMWKNLGREED